MKQQASAVKFVGKISRNFAKVIRLETLIRWLGLPFQKLLDHVGGTHEFLTTQSVRILDNDGWKHLSRYCSEHLETIIKGNYWADTLWKNTTHHYNPRTKKGLWLWPGAQDQMNNWFNQAIGFWLKGKTEKALHALGACLHIVQDCCQPYHSNCVIFRGHQKYEKWADLHKENFAVSRGGIYKFSGEAEDWVADNAQFSVGYLETVANSSPIGNKKRKEATAILLARAQKTTAGFIMFFFDKIRSACEDAETSEHSAFLDAMLTQDKKC